MRRAAYASLVAIAVSILFAGIDRTNANQANDKEKLEKLKIVPVTVVKVGEEKELTLSTQCTVGATRGGGFNLVEIGGKSDNLRETKIWKRDGVTIEVPDFAEGERQASSPLYKPFRDAGVNVFSVKIKAEKDAKPGIYNLHLVDQTCSGWCTTDFRVLVVAH